MHVFVTGATGLIGRALVPELLRARYAVTALTRSAAPGAFPPGVDGLRGDPTTPGPWQEALAACDACVHLAGAPVAAGRWTAERKAEIRRSRVESTRLVAEAVRGGAVQVLVSGSAVGWYGAHGDEVLDESAPRGEGFLAAVCEAWEAAASPAREGARVVLLRTGIVLAREGGALPQMLLPFRAFMGGPIGRGAFWQPWIHLADEVGLVLWALQTAAVEGPLNAAAPEPVTNRDFARALGHALRRPSVVPVPPKALKLAMGELASVVTTGQRVVPAKALLLGYRYRFPKLGPALEDLLGRHP